MLAVNNLTGFGSGGGPAPPTLTYVTRTDIKTTQSSSYTFSSHTTGTAASDRTIIIAIMIQDDNDEYVTGVTVGGSSMAKQVDSSSVNDGHWASIWSLNKASGTSEDIVVSISSANALACSISVYTAYGLESATATATGSSTATTLAVASHTTNAVGICIGIAATNDPATAFAWTNLDEDNDASYGQTSSFISSAASIVNSSATTETKTATRNDSGSTKVLCVASFA